DPRRKTLSVRILSHNWTGRFINKHPHLKSITSKPTERAGNEACTRENFNEWFEHCRNAISTYKAESHNIYNIDETGFQMGSTFRTYVIVDKNQRTAGRSGAGPKGERLTVIECGCADGTALPAFIIFKGSIFKACGMQMKHQK